jgi:hypothetical protein
MLARCRMLITAASGADTRICPHKTTATITHTRMVLQQQRPRPPVLLPPGRDLDHVSGCENVQF